jgi:hypothetical protein
VSDQAGKLEVVAETAEVARVLTAERAQIDLVTPIDGRLQWPYPPSADDATAIAAGIPTSRAGRIRGLAGIAMTEPNPGGPLGGPTQARRRAPRLTRAPEPPVAHCRAV